MYQREIGHREAQGEIYPREEGCIREGIDMYRLEESDVS